MAQPESPEQSYFPSCKIRFGIRFDELGRRVFKGVIPPKPLHKLSGVKDPRAPLKLVNDPDAPAGTRRTLLSFDASKKLVGQGPQKQVSSKDGLTHTLAGIMPKDATWQQNGVRTADTLSITFRYVDLPITPLALRSAWVQLYLGTVTDEEYHRGINGETRTVQLSEGRQLFEPMNLVPDTYVDPSGQKRTNLRFQGFVDKWDNEFADGEPIIRVECRDNTQLVLDIDCPSKLTINKAIPIDKAIATYLSHFPQLDGMVVEYKPSDTKETDIPVLKNIYSKASFPPQLGPSPSLVNGQPSGMTVWDFLTDVVGSLGHLIYVDGNTIVIERSRSKVGENNKSVVRPDDPFKGRNGRVFRQFIYGRNLAELKISRSFVKTVPTNIEVRSYNPVTKSPTVARYPTNRVGDGIHTSIPGDGGAEEKWLVMRVPPGIVDKDTLRILAQNYYEQLGRQELQVKIKTKNLASFGGGNLDPDILDLKATDTFELLFNRGDDDEKGDPANSSTVTTIEKQLSVFKERNVQFMKSRGFPEKFSQAYAKIYTDLGFQTAYRVKTMQVQWNVDAGVTIEIDAVNYVEARADPLKLPSSVSQELKA